MFNADSALNGGESLAFSSAGGAPSPAASDCIVVPDAHLLFDGEFKRIGSSDLKIVGSDGDSFFIENYFAHERQPHLMSPEGALLTANVVSALAGPLAPGQSAQAGAQPAGQPAIGRVEAVSGSATVVRNGVTVTLSVGDTVRKGDVVQTAGASSVAIVLADGSTFSLSANARMVLDDFVFTAGGSNNSALVSLVQGTFSFVAGQVAKTGDMRVETPVATMGIRGTAVLVEISANDGRTRFSVMVEPDGTTGSYNLYNKTTGALIATVNNSNVGWVLTPAGPLQVVAQQEQKTPAQLQQELSIVQQIFTIFNNYQQNPFTPQNDPDRRGQTDPNTKTTSTTGSGTLLNGTDGGGGPTETEQTPSVITVTVTKIEQPETVTLPVDPPVIETGDPQIPTLPNIVPNIETFTIINGAGTITGTPRADHIFGSSGRDIIDALAGDDMVFAGGGNDTVIAGHGEGNDIYDGGTGFDDISFASTTQGVVINLNVRSVEGVKISTADGPQTGHDEFAHFEKVVGGGGNDIFVLHDTTQWELDAGGGIDIIRIANGLDFFGLIEGPDIVNFEIVDLATDSAQNIVEFDVGDFGDFGNIVPFRVLGGPNDIVLLTNNWFLGADWQQVADNVLADSVFTDGLTAGVHFDVFQGTVGDHTFTVYVQDGITIVPPADANDDQAAMGENGEVLVDVLANDIGMTKALIGLGPVTVNGPSGVPLGIPAVTIENQKIKIVAGTAFESLAENETASIAVPYTMQTVTGETVTATAFITVTGTNDAPTFTSHVGFNRSASEDDGPVTFDLLQHAHDPDTYDTLSAVNVIVTAHDQFGNAVDVTGAVTQNGHLVTVDPAFFESLTEGQSVTVAIDYDLSDGQLLVHNTATLVVNGENDGAQNDTATMTENQVKFVDVLANDEGSGKTLKSIGAVSIAGPNGVTLGTPAIVIENGQIRITPGTAFDALAQGEMATITIPYTMQTSSGETFTAMATVTVTGTNDAPQFSLLPEGFQSIGTITRAATFGGVDALKLTTDGASVAQIESFLGLTSGTLANISAQDSAPNLHLNPTDGSAIAFGLFLEEGESISFSWNFASTEYEPFNDFAFVSLAPTFGDKLADIFAIGDGVNDGFLHSSGWQSYTFTATDSGLHKLGVGVVNTGDTAFDSDLYISGFSGLGFRRTTTEDGAVETFNLLNGAFDPDTHDLLTATNVVATGHDQNGNAVNVLGAVTIGTTEVSIDPSFFNYLNNGETVTVVVTYDVFDGHTTTQNSATLVITGANEVLIEGGQALDVNAAPLTAPVAQIAAPELEADVVDVFQAALDDLNRLQQDVTATPPSPQSGGTDALVFGDEIAETWQPPLSPDQIAHSEPCNAPEVPPIESAGVDPELSCRLSIEQWMDPTIPADQFVPHPAQSNYMLT